MYHIKKTQISSSNICNQRYVLTNNNNKIRVYSYSDGETTENVERNEPCCYFVVGLLMNLGARRNFLKAFKVLAKKFGAAVVSLEHRILWKEQKNVEHKGSVDLVTETDKDCEHLIFKLEYYGNVKNPEDVEENLLTCLAELFMQISTQKKKTGVIAPKRFVQRVKKENEFFRGFMHQDAHEFSFPFVCVSIGLTIKKLPVVGVVYNPIMNEFFTAIHGLGAFLNGKPIKVSSQSQLVTCLLTIEVIRILPYSAVQLFAYESYKVSKNY